VQNFSLAGVARPTKAMLFMDGYLGFDPTTGSFNERFFFGRHQIGKDNSLTRTSMSSSGCPGYAMPTDARLYNDSGINFGFVDGHAKFMLRGKHMEKIQQADGTWIWRYLTADL